MKRWCQFIVMVALCRPAPAPAMSCSDAGLALPPTVQLGRERGAELVLNGVGSRTKYLWDVYVAALYLPVHSAEPKEILVMPGPKRIWLHFVRDVSAAKLREGWRDGFVRNNAPEALAALEARLDASYGLFRDVRAGQQIALDYLPGEGTRVEIDAAAGPLIPGDDFYRAVLKVWLGDHPAQSGLKECLLGRAAGG